MVPLNNYPNLLNCVYFTDCDYRVMYNNDNVKFRMLLGRGLPSLLRGYNTYSFDSRFLNHIIYTKFHCRSFIAHTTILGSELSLEYGQETLGNNRVMVQVLTSHRWKYFIQVTFVLVYNIYKRVHIYLYFLILS